MMRPQNSDPCRPDFLVKLGVLLPCTEQDVKEAYFARIRKAHPDVGGNIHEFIELQEAFERALEYARSEATRSRWLASLVERYAAQGKLIAAIEELGGQVEIEPVRWLSREIGEDFAHLADRLIGIECRGPAFDDRLIDFLLRHKSELGYLKKLDLAESGITDAGLLRLRALTNLHELNISRTRVGNAGLKVLNQLTDLQWMGLEKTAVNVLGHLQLDWNRPYLQVSLSNRETTRFSRPLFRLVLSVFMLYYVAMVLVTHLHVPDMSQYGSILISDKWLHGAMYGGFALLSSLLLVVSWPVPHHADLFRGKRKMAGLWLALSAYGLLDEVTQLAVGRSFEWLDWAANLAGIAWGIVMFHVLVVVARRCAPSVWRLPATEVEKIEHWHRLRNSLLVDLPAHSQHVMH